MPNKAYLISLPVDKPKRDFSLQLLGELGFDVEVIDGIKSVQVRRFCSLPSPGISLAQKGHVMKTIATGHPR